MTDEILIEARGVTRILAGIVPTTLVHGIDLAIRDNEFVAITGPSGSGKSSLLYLLGLLDLPTEGEVTIRRKGTAHMTEEERARVRLSELGFVFQFHFLLPEFTALENVMLPMRALGQLSREAMRKRATDLLDALGLAEHARKRPDQLSGGQRQRVAVARSLANDPPIILADEPTGSLELEIERAGVRDPPRPRGAARQDRGRGNARSRSRGAHDSARAVGRRHDRERRGCAGHIVLTRLQCASRGHPFRLGPRARLSEPAWSRYEASAIAACSRRCLPRRDDEPIFSLRQSTQPVP